MSTLPIDQSLLWKRGLIALAVLVLSVAHFNVARGLYLNLPAFVGPLTKTTEATVILKSYETGRSTGRSGSTTYTYYVTYLYDLPAAGEEQHFEVKDQVPLTAYDAATEGKAVSIRYLAAAPGLSVVDGYATERGLFVGLLGALLLLIDAAIVWAIRARRRTTSARRA